MDRRGFLRGSLMVLAVAPVVTAWKKHNDDFRQRRILG